MADEIKKQTGAEVTLIEGRGGVFKVRVGDDIVAQKTTYGFPDEQTVVDAVAAKL